MKKRYRIWHLPVRSFYSKPLHRDVTARWKGPNLGYLSLLLYFMLVPCYLCIAAGSTRQIRPNELYLEEAHMGS